MEKIRLRPEDDRYEVNTASGWAKDQSDTGDADFLAEMLPGEKQSRRDLFDDETLRRFRLTPETGCKPETVNAPAMETQIWLNSKKNWRRPSWADILMLRGHEVCSLRVMGDVLTLKRNVKAVIDELKKGQPPPSGTWAKWFKTLDARTLGKAVVNEDNSSLSLQGGGDGSTKLTYPTDDFNADEIVQVILAKCGRTFQPTKEQIGVVEALIPPAILGAVGGLCWWAVLYQPAGRIAAGEELQRVRRSISQRLLLWVAELLGTGGTVVVGVLLLVLILGGAAKRVARRPRAHRLATREGLTPSRRMQPGRLIPAAYHGQVTRGDAEVEGGRGRRRPASLGRGDGLMACEGVRSRAVRGGIPMACRPQATTRSRWLVARRSIGPCVTSAADKQAARPS